LSWLQDAQRIGVVSPRADYHDGLKCQNEPAVVRLRAPSAEVQRRA
jgi:hypothetical protein